MPRRTSARWLIDDVYDIPLPEKVVRPAWSAIRRIYPECAQPAAVKEQDRISLCDALWPQHLYVHLSGLHFFTRRTRVFTADVKKFVCCKCMLAKGGDYKA